MGILPFLLASLAVTPLPQDAVAKSAPVQERYPALWVVNDDDTIIYLFGTFHALDARSEWFAQAVRTAFFQSDQLVLETLVPRPPSYVPAALPASLSPVSNAGQPGTMAELAPGASFLATTRLVMHAGRASGLSTDHGADAVLRDVADHYGKPVGGLESFQSQLTMFNSLPKASGQIPSPQDPQAVKALGDMLARLQSAWRRGEIETFAPMLNKMQAQSPQTYDTMFVQRNARWAGWIANRLKSPGTVFVAVGAGHLSGPDSVQNQLAMRGVKSARVN